MKVNDMLAGHDPLEADKMAALFKKQRRALAGDRVQGVSTIFFTVVLPCAPKFSTGSVLCVV